MSNEATCHSHGCESKVIGACAKTNCFEPVCEDHSALCVCCGDLFCERDSAWLFDTDGRCESCQPAESLQGCAHCASERTVIEERDGEVVYRCLSCGHVDIDLGFYPPEEWNPALEEPEVPACIAARRAAGFQDEREVA